MVQTYGRHIGTMFVARHFTYKINTVDLRSKKQKGIRNNTNII